MIYHTYSYSTYYTHTHIYIYIILICYLRMLAVQPAPVFPVRSITDTAAGRRPVPCGPCSGGYPAPVA